MSKINRFYLIKEESRNEIYEYIDRNMRKLSRHEDGRFNELEDGFVNNDVDALRHAYVSGVYTINYGEEVTDLLGRLNELTNISYGRARKNEENMDLWNNSVGRKYGKKSKSKADLIEFLMKALKNGELIIDPRDKRQYKGASLVMTGIKGLVIVLEESESGRNEVFYDVENKKVMARIEFVAKIEAGDYMDYTIKQINGEKTPVSKKDRFKFNNLG